MISLFAYFEDKIEFTLTSNPNLNMYIDSADILPFFE
jgi:hypothetical protein